MRRHLILVLLTLTALTGTLSIFSGCGVGLIPYPTTDTVSTPTSRAPTTSQPAFEGGLGYVISGAMGAAGATGPSENDVGEALQIDSLGNLVVAGFSGNAAGGIELALWRYKANGALDPTFGTGGVALFGATGAAGGTGSGEIDYGITLQIDSSGNPVVAGISQNASEGQELALWRYRANGTLDPTFGTGGVVVNGETGAAGGTGSGEHDIVNALQIDSSGKVVVAGFSRNVAGGAELALWRYRANGTLDSTFGTGGVVLNGNTGAAGATGPDENDSANSLQIDSSGKWVVMGGSNNAAGGTELALWRYTANGTLDPTFGIGGVVLFGATGSAGGTGSGESDYGGALQIDGSGNLVIAGLSKNTAGGFELALWRYKANGTLDPTFGTGGVVVSGETGVAGGTGSGEFDAANSLQIDSSGNLVISGVSKNTAGGFELVLWRYKVSGTLDPTFGTGGVAIFGATGAANGTGSGEVDYGETLQIDVSGNLVVGGTSKNAAGGLELALWKYLTTGVLDK